MTHVVLIHGMANKPNANDLHRIWRESLKHGTNSELNIDLGAEGIETSMVYWADVLYEHPEDSANYESVSKTPPDASIELQWNESVTEEEAKWLQSLADKYDIELGPPNGDDNYSPPINEADGSFERIPLPWFIKRRIMKALLRDVHHYLFNAEHSPREGTTYKVQDEVRRRFVSGLQAAEAGGGPIIVVSHSLGTVVAYDCLKRVPDCPEIAGLVTIGSPLGIDEIQDKFKPEWSNENGFPSEKLSGSWINIYDPIDVVSRLDAKISNDYKKAGNEVIVDLKQENDGPWTHSITKYLSGDALKTELRQMLSL